MFLLYYFQFLRRDISGSDGEHAGEFHKDATGFAYSYYFSFYSFEDTLLYFHFLSFAESVADFCEVDEVLVECRGDCYEVFHFLFRNGERGVDGAVPVVVDWACVAEAADVGV